MKIKLVRIIILPFQIVCKNTILKGSMIFYFCLYHIIKRKVIYL